MSSTNTRRTFPKSASNAKDPTLAAQNHRRVQTLKAEDAALREHSLRLRAARTSLRPNVSARTPSPQPAARPPSATAIATRAPLSSMLSSPAATSRAQASPVPTRVDTSLVPPVQLSLCSSVIGQRQRRTSVGVTASEPVTRAAWDGEAAQRVAFSLTGPYQCVAFAESSAALWASNGETGEIDIFSAISGALLTHIPARLAVGLSNGMNAVPTVLRATRCYVWAGHNDGSVSVYDHLCVSSVTAGRFHSAPVVGICAMADGTVVSGSIDMVFVRWDKEVKCFEAITRIVGISEAHQSLACMEALGDKIVLCGSRAGSILLVNCESGLQVASLRGHSGRVHALVVLDDLLFSAAEDKVVNVWSMPSGSQIDAELMQRSCKLLKRIPVQLVVRDMVAHAGSRSLWVAYTDGLVERWSANPDDDFGVEQVVREAFGDTSDSLLEQLDVRALHCVGTVETMRVLAIGSNGVSKVWLNHRNVIEDSLEESIAAMRAVIAQDTAEAVVWRQKALAVKRRELKRKDTYCAIIKLYHTRRLLFSYFTKWQGRLAAHRLCERQHEEICLHLEARYEFRLRRRYFTLWCRFYDKEQRRFRRQHMAIALERVSMRTWEAQIISRWRRSIAARRIRRRQRAAMEVLAAVSSSATRAAYFAKWLYSLRRMTDKHVSTALAQCPVAESSNGRSAKAPREQSALCVMTAERMALLTARARRRVLRTAYDHWRRTHAMRPSHILRNTSATSLRPVPFSASPAAAAAAAVVPAARPSSSLSSTLSTVSLFAAAYADVNVERWRRRVLTQWRRWHERRRVLHALRALAAAMSRQRSRALQFRALSTWYLLMQWRRLVRLEESVHAVETQLRDAEEAHADIFDKLQLQKRLDQLRRQYEQDSQQLREAQETAAQLSDERDAVRRTGTSYGQTANTAAHHNSGSNNNNNNNNNNSNSYGNNNSGGGLVQDEETKAALAVFNPAVLHRLPSTETAAFVMTRLKGAVLNMYTDMPLFRQIRDRMRCGTTAAVVFLEGFQEVKRVVVTLAKAPVGAAPRAGDRWRLTADMLETMPQHQCAAVLQAFKAMVVAHDMVAAADGESVALTREEIVANADLLFLLWRACYAARKPQLPANNRVSMRT